MSRFPSNSILGAACQRCGEPGLTPFLVFALSAAVVAAAGVRLARDGDVIAEGTGLGGAWVGAILVAAATSLPELATDINAVLQDAPDLAVGDLFGSSMANLLILAVADQLTRSPRMLTRVATNQALVGVLGVALAAVAVLGIVTTGLMPRFALGWAPLAIVAIYAAGMRLLHVNRAVPPFRRPEEVIAAHPRRRELRRAAIGFAVAAIVILVTAPHLAASAAGVAEHLGVSQGFVGALLLAITTSLPEVSVSITSVRAGSYDLAVGNLLGSNCFNMAMLLPLDLVHTGSPLLGSVRPGLAIAGLAAIVMTSLALLDILNKSERRVWKLEPLPTAMIFVYLAALFVLERATG